MRVGLIGCGGIAPVHIRVYKQLKDIEVVGVCDINLERAKKVAAAFKIPSAYSNYHDMFAKERLDLVDICTPPSTHVPIVCDAAEAVPSILLEKPMAFNVVDCDKIISKVEKNGRKLCIGHSQLFSPHIQRAKKIADSDGFNLQSFRTSLKASFEKLRSLDLAPPWNVTPEQKGIIWEVCCHHAYLQLHFLPNIKEVYAVGGKVKYPVYDDFSVLLRTSDDCFGSIELSWVSNEFEVLYELRGKTGRRVQINWEYDQMLELSEDPPYTVKGVAKSAFADQKRLWQKWARFGTGFLAKRKLLPTFNLISSYIDSIKNDSAPPVTAQDGRNTIRLLESIQSSLDRKAPVAISC
jgi:UDP-N-acetylglucosamine 3-dehydrogenase